LSRIALPQGAHAHCRRDSNHTAGRNGRMIAPSIPATRLI
jgi:hypothetical protein